MQGVPRALILFLAVVLAMPSALAEFGPESEDGYPINVNGEVMRPPVLPTPLTQVDPNVAAAYGLTGAVDPLNKVGPFTTYPYYPLLTAELQRLATDHPNLVKLTSAGKSTAQLDMWLLQIADFDNPNMIPLENREVIYLDGGTHSNEYSGVYFVTELAQFLLDEYETNETAKWLVEHRSIWILPMINPDGSNAFGRLNAQGVNVNRNFPGTWGTVEENPVLNNPGASPASEIETKNVMALMEAIQPDYVNSIHCCGNLWLHPYGAEQLQDPVDLQMYTRICDEVFSEVRDRCGEIWSTIYPASGTTADEGYELIGASSWTYEMSGRSNVAGPWGEPAVMTDVREQERESWAGVMHAMLNVEKYGARPSLLSLEGDATGLTAVIENVGYGNLTSGTVRIGDVSVAMPLLLPNETATLRIDGDFAAGATLVHLDWIKRSRHQTPGHEMVVVALADSDGRLVGTIPADSDLFKLGSSDDSIEPLATEGDARVPAPAPLVIIGLVVGVALSLRRKW